MNVIDKDMTWQKISVVGVSGLKQVCLVWLEI